MRKRGRPPYPDLLTPREQEVLSLLREGLNNPQIADRLGISRDGVKYHVSEILSKLGVASREEAARWRPEERRPWWAGAFAPFPWLWRRAPAAVMPTVTVGAVVLFVAVLGGLGFLAFLLVSQGASDASVDKIAFSRDGDIYTMNPAGGGQTNLTESETFDRSPTWSPDGQRLAFERISVPGEIFVMDADGSDAENLTNHPAIDQQPAWSPDGSKIAFISDRDGNFEVYVMNADGSEPENLTNHPDDDWFPSWSPDGTSILFHRGGSLGGAIWMMDADGGNPTQITESISDSDPALSPDGSRIAFVGRPESQIIDGQPTFEIAEIYVMNADGTERTRLTFDPDATSNRHPAWSPDGSMIVFDSSRAGQADIYVMNPDGTGQTNLTQHPGDDSRPAWQPSVSPGGR